jgi:hypothetical protein
VSRYTNLESGATFQRRFDSLVPVTTRPNGSLKVTGLNDILLWGPEPLAMGLGPGLWLLDAGKVTIKYDAAGELVSARRHFGRAINVCNRLD